MYVNPGIQQMQPGLGSSHYPPSFSYAQPVPHAQHQGAALMGNRLVSGAIGATSGALDMASTGLGALGAVQLGSSLLGMPVLSSGAIGALTGATGGAGVMSLLGGPAGIAVMGGSAAASLAHKGVANANQVGNMFGNFQFANAGGDPRTGRGFSQQDLMTLQRGVYAIDKNNPFVSFQDAMRVADRFTEMGMHQGVQDAEKLSKKITQLGKTLHQMARHLGTTLEESSQIFSQMKSAGYYSEQDVMGNVQNLTLMRGYGMSSDQFSQMQMQGAGMSRSAQMSGRAGAGMMTAKTADFMRLIRTGAMSSTEMMDITGASSPLEAAQLMAQQTTASTMQGLQGGLGTAMLLSLGKTDKTGRFTGEVDAGLLERMSRGEVTRDEMMRIGAGKRDSRAGQTSFMARKTDITESLLESEQAQEALFGMIKSIAKQIGGESAGEDENYLELVAETQLQIDRRTFRALQKMSETRRQRAGEAVRELKTNERAAFIKENRSLEGIRRRIEQTFSTTGLSMPFSEAYREQVGGLQDLERKLLGGSNDLTFGVSDRALQDAIVEGPAMSGVKLGLGDAARAAAMQGNVGIFEQGMGSLDTSDYERRLSGKFKAGELENRLAGIQEGIVGYQVDSTGQRVAEGTIRRDKKLSTGQLDEIAAQIGLGRNYDREKLLAAIGKKGGDIGRVMAAEGALELPGASGQTTDLKAAQDQMRAALSSPFDITDADSTAGKVVLGMGAYAQTFAGPLAVLAAGAIVGIDTDTEEARDMLSQGGEATGLLGKYADNQKEIDQILQEANTPEQQEAAVRKLNARFRLNLSTKDLNAIKTTLQQQFGKTASQRVAQGVDTKKASTLSNLAKGIESTGTAQKRRSAMEGVIKARGTASSGAGSLEDQMAAAIQSAAAEGFTASTEDSSDLRTLAFGANMFKSLEAAKEGGLTLTEMRDLTGFDESQLNTIISRSGGTLEAGKFIGNEDKLISALSTKATTLVATSADPETILNSGMAETERQSLSVFKTAQLVDQLYKQYYKTEAAVADPTKGKSP
jgi:hypothetical protein